MRALRGAIDGCARDIAVSCVAFANGERIMAKRTRSVENVLRKPIRGPVNPPVLGPSPPTRVTLRRRMSVAKKLKNRVRHAVRIVTHDVEYGRHLVRGNKVASDMTWTRSELPPVVLVHGFLGTRGTMLPLTRAP